MELPVPEASRKALRRVPMSDPIECLPEPVLHHILSLLPSCREAARAALISRSWWHAWSSFPVFDFRYFIPKGRYSFDRITPEVREINDRFLGFVDRSVSRLCERGIRLPRLKIWTRLLGSDHSRALFNKWIDGKTLMVPPASTVNLNSLESLEFRGTRIDDQMLQKLLREMS